MKNETDKNLLADIFYLPVARKATRFDKLAAQARRQGCLLERKGKVYLLDNNRGTEAECRTLNEIAATLQDSDFKPLQPIDI